MNLNHNGKMTGMKLKIDLGAKIRARREKLGFKVYELANKVGVSPVYITQIEKHNKIPSPEILGKIATHLQDDIESYFRIYQIIKFPELLFYIRKGR